MARNLKSRSRDMVISLAVIAVPVLLIIIFFTSTPKQEVQAIDLDPYLSRVSEESPYPVLVASGLSDEWTPLRANWAKTGQTWITAEPALGNSWQLGYLSPEEIYFGVLQRDDAGADLVRLGTSEGRSVGDEATVAGRTWERFESKDGRTRSLVNELDGVTTVVSADTDFVELEAFASTLVEHS